MLSGGKSLTGISRSTFIVGSIVVIVASSIISIVATSQLSLAQGNPHWKEPSTLTIEIETRQDILDDLEALGCILIDGSYDVYENPRILIENYVEFRRIVYNTRVVFYRLWGSEEMACYTIFEGVVAVNPFVIS